MSANATSKYRIMMYESIDTLYFLKQIKKDRDKRDAENSEYYKFLIRPPVILKDVRIDPIIIRPSCSIDRCRKLRKNCELPTGFREVVNYCRPLLDEPKEKIYPIDLMDSAEWTKKYFQENVKARVDCVITPRESELDFNHVNPPAQYITREERDIERYVLRNAGKEIQPIVEPEPVEETEPICQCSDAFECKCECGGECICTETNKNLPDDLKINNFPQYKDRLLPTTFRPRARAEFKNIKFNKCGQIDCEQPGSLRYIPFEEYNETYRVVEEELNAKPAPKRKCSRTIEFDYHKIVQPTTFHHVRTTGRDLKRDIRLAKSPTIKFQKFSGHNTNRQKRYMKVTQYQSVNNKIRTKTSCEDIGLVAPVRCAERKLQVRNLDNSIINKKATINETGKKTSFSNKIKNIFGINKCMSQMDKYAARMTPEDPCKKLKQK